MQAPFRYGAVPMSGNVAGTVEELPRRHTRRWIVLGVGVLLLLLAADGAWATLAARRNLQTARDDLQSAVDAMVKGDVNGAGADLRAAASAAGAVNSFRHHPAVWLAGALPWVGDNIAAIDALGDSAALAAQAGNSVVDAARAAGWEQGGIPGLSGNKLSASQLAQVAPQLDQAAATLGQAQARLAQVSTNSLVSSVKNAVLTARDKFAGDIKLLSSATDIARVLPRLLTNGNRYLLMVQNPDEPRGTGGFAGFYGFLTVQGGHFHLDKIFPLTAPRLGAPVAAAADYRARWAQLDGLVDLRQTNYEPDLPTTSGVVLQIAQRLGWGKFDGIIMVDQVWMQQMLRAMGPVTSSAWPVPLTADNVIPVLSHDVFFVPDANRNGDNSDESNAAQTQIALDIWNAFQSRQIPPADLASATATSAAERHLMLYSTDAATEALLTKLGAAGNTGLGTNPIYVTWSALSANKVGYDQKRSVAVDVTLAGDGTATVKTTLHLQNNASASGSPGEYYGDGTDFPLGTFAAYTSVYFPKSVSAYPVFNASGSTVTGVQKDQGFPVAIGYVHAPSGGNFTWSVTYTAPNAVTQVGTQHEYRLDFLPQPTLSGIPLSVSIHLPDGSTVASASPGVSTGGASATYSDTPLTPTSIWVRY